MLAAMLCTDAATVGIIVAGREGAGAGKDKSLRPPAAVRTTGVWV